MRDAGATEREPNRVRRVAIRYDVPVVSDDWILPEVPVPEGVPHRELVELLAALLEAWAERTSRNVLVARNLAVRWDAARPRIGVDPDVCLIDPAPPESHGLASLLLWKSGHVAPRLCIEVVSPNHPYKDYDIAPHKYAALGAEELVVFDPEHAGPKHSGGPYLLQMWRRAPDGAFERVHVADAAVRSSVLDAFFVPVDAGTRLRIADDIEGRSLWLTREEAALKRVAELEAKLAERERR